MDIRAKTIRAVATVTLVLIVAVALATQTFIQGSLDVYERESVAGDVNLARNLLRDKIEGTERVVEDWAFWSDAYAFMGGQNPAFITENLTVDTLKNLSFDFILFFDSAGELAAELGFDRKKGRIENPDPDIVRFFSEHKRDLLKTPQDKRRCGGLVSSGGAAFLAAIRPILDNNGQGKARGTLVMGKRLDASELAHLSRISGFRIALSPLNEAGNSRAPGPTRGDVSVSTSDDGAMTGMITLPDVLGQPALVLKVFRAARLSRYGRLALGIQILSILGLGAAFFFVIRRLLEKNVFSRLRSIISEVGRVEDAQDPSLRLEENGDDEFSRLGESINRMLSALQASQDALVSARRRYQAVIESQKEFICRFGKDGVLTFVNDAYGAFLGLTAEKLIGMHCPLLFQNGEGRFEEAISGINPERPVKTVRLQMPAEDGTIRWFEVNIQGLFHVNGALEEYQAVGREVTANILADERLRLAHEEIETLFSSISSVLICVDGEDRIRRWNMGAEQTFGRSVRETADRSIRDVVDWDWEAVEEAFASCRKNMAAVRLDDVPFVRADGKKRLLGMTANPVPSESDCPGILLLAQDITEIKSREARVSHEMKMQSIGRLAAGIAHEINTPVQYLSYNLGFLKDAFEDVRLLVEADGNVTARACQALRKHDRDLANALAEEIASVEKEIDLEYLSQDIPVTVANSLKGLQQVADIVRAMKEFSHPGVMDKVALDVNSALRNTVMISRNEWKHLAEVRLDLAEDLPLLYGLPQELNQVFLNLIMNASQAIEESQAASPGTLGEIVISSRRLDGMIEVSFADTGPGIPEDIRSKIFEPFFTTKPVGKGTGQGLAISHAVIVQRFGGEIVLSTEEGKGSVFTVRLPERGISEAPDRETEGTLQA